MIDDLLYRLRALLRRRTVENELDDELRFHLERAAEKHERAGASPEEALRRARLEFGGVDPVKEASREARGTALLETCVRDLRYAARILCKSPGFTLVAVLCLALGMGANTAVFQLVDSVCLRTLPVRDPRSLVAIRLSDYGTPRGNFDRSDALTNPIWERLRERREAFTNLFAWADDSFSLAGSGEVRTIKGLWVSGEFFPTLGIQPVLGRLFTPADDRRGCGLQGVVISYGFWQSQFGGDPSVVGRELPLGGGGVPVAGVTPPGFLGLDVGRTFDVALPICAEAKLRVATHRLDSGITWYLTVMGRARPGWSIQRASAYVQSLSPGLFQATLPPRYPSESVKDYLALKLRALPAATGISGLRNQYAEPLWFLLATAGLVLFVASANLANLMLARASAREREIAVRLAIGASRSRLLGQFLAESGLIALLGAAAGLLASRELTQLLVTQLGAGANSVFLDLRPDWRVLAFTIALGAVTCLLFGLAPALRATGRAAAEGLRAESRGITSGRRRFGLQRILVTAQIALSLVLVTGALLFAGTLHNLASLQPGFQPTSLLNASVGFGRLNLPQARYLPFRRELAERLQAIPGIESVAEVTIAPLSGLSRSNATWMDGATRNPGDQSLSTDVGPGYFHTMRTPLLAGREFDGRDVPGAPKVAIVNQAFAARIARTGNPVGRRFWIEATPSDPETLYEIVGLAANAKYNDLREDFSPVTYFPVGQLPYPGAGGRFLIRATLPLDRAAPAVRQALMEIDPNIRYTLQVLETQISNSLLRERLMATLSGAFGLLAALLSAVGLYGVVSFLTARRRSEIGIRIALGAGSGTIVSMVLRETAALVVAGITVGAVLAVLLARTAETLLFGLKPYDPVTLLTAIAALSAAALIASYLPARRAASLNPTAALRED